MKSKSCNVNCAIQGRYPHPSYRSTANDSLTPRDCGNSTQTIMRDKTKRLQLGRLSSSILTTAGPGIKNPSPSTTKLRRWKHCPPAITGGVCPQTGAITLFQALHKQRNLPRSPMSVELLTIPTTTVSHRGGSCPYLARNPHIIVLGPVEDSCYPKALRKRFSIPSYEIKAGRGWKPLLQLKLMPMQLRRDDE
jgi:hypothetical protein